MRSYQPSSDRRRAVSLALTVAAHVLIAWLLWQLAPVFDPHREPGRSLTVNMLPVGDNNSTATRSAKAPARAAQASRRTAPDPPAAPKPPAEDRPVPPPVDTPFPGYLVLSKNDFAASDVGKIPSRKSGGSAGRQMAAAAEGQGDGDDGETTAAAGIGPGGQRLYAAEWYVRPAASQLNPYMPRNIVPAGSWAEIACRTAPNYRVEDCVQIGDSRPGLGLARAIREAAWQFKIRPPRINGKPQIGAWVRIHYDIVEGRLTP